MSVISVNAPAKINLGLEILGRRDDGFHEIRSVLAKISLCDALEFTPSAGDEDEICLVESEPGIPTSDNLVLTALSELRHAGWPIPSQRIRMTKRIPVAAGLGGASTDAAATLRLFGNHAGIPHAALHAMASRVGSDVPFFLGGDFALASGRGENLQSLPAPRSLGWVVIVTPPVHVPAKTATLYAAVKPSWWTDGSMVERYARSFPNLTVPPPPNVFEHAMIALRPEVAILRDALTNIGFPFVALSGAGPSIYTIIDAEEKAHVLATRAAAIDADAAIHVARLGDACNSCDAQEAVEQ